MAPPACVSNTLDLAVDPQFVHELAQTLNASVGDKRTKILRFVPAIRFHPAEDCSGVFAQRMHHYVLWLAPTMPAPSLSRISFYDFGADVLAGSVDRRA